MKIKKISLIIGILVLFVGIIFIGIFTFNNKINNSKKNITNDKVVILCLDEFGTYIENTEIGITGLTNKEIVELHTTDNYGKIIINNPTISIITLMIVNENLSFFSQIELTEENINSNEVLTVTFDDYIFTK